MNNANNAKTVPLVPQRPGYLKIKPIAPPIVLCGLRVPKSFNSVDACHCYKQTCKVVAHPVYTALCTGVAYA